MGNQSTDRPKSWWETLPGTLTAIAAIITAITGLVVALHQLGPGPVQPESKEKQTQAPAAPGPKTSATSTSELPQSAMPSQKKAASESKRAEDSTIKRTTRNHITSSVIPAQNGRIEAKANVSSTPVPNDQDKRRRALEKMSPWLGQWTYQYYKGQNSHEYTKELYHFEVGLPEDSFQEPKCTGTISISYSQWHKLDEKEDYGRTCIMEYRAKFRLISEGRLAFTATPRMEPYGTDCNVPQSTTGLISLQTDDEIATVSSEIGFLNGTGPGGKRVFSRTTVYPIEEWLEKKH